MSELFANVTEDTINYIAQAEFSDTHGRPVVLKDPNGKPKIKACMWALGFDSRYGNRVVLRPEKEVQHRVESVLVRHPLKKEEVQYKKVYSGKLREVYEPPEELHKWLRNIHFEGDLMHIVNQDETVKVSSLCEE